MNIFLDSIGALLYVIFRLVLTPFLLAGYSILGLIIALQYFFKWLGVVQITPVKVKWPTLQLNFKRPVLAAKG